MDDQIIELFERISRGYAYAFGWESIEDAARYASSLMPEDWGLALWFGPDSFVFQAAGWAFAYLSMAAYFVPIEVVTFALVFVLAAELLMIAVHAWRFLRNHLGIGRTAPL